jgi:hypothetical protein
MRRLFVSLFAAAALSAPMVASPSETLAQDLHPPVHGETPNGDDIHNDIHNGNGDDDTHDGDDDTENGDD